MRDVVRNKGRCTRRVRLPKILVLTWYVRSSASTWCVIFAATRGTAGPFGGGAAAALAAAGFAGASSATSAAASGFAGAALAAACEKCIVFWVN